MQNTNPRFVKFFEEYALIMDFRYCLKKSYKNFRKFLKYLQKFGFFSPNERKTNAFFVKLFWKIFIFAIFLRNCLKIFENSQASLGASPPDPLRGRPPKVFPANRNPGRAAADNLVSKFLFDLDLLTLT